MHWMNSSCGRINKILLHYVYVYRTSTAWTNRSPSCRTWWGPGELQGDDTSRATLIPSWCPCRYLSSVYSQCSNDETESVGTVNWYLYSTFKQCFTVPVCNNVCVFCFFLSSQSKLASMSNDFKSVLEVRTEVASLKPQTVPQRIKIKIYFG